MYFAMFILFMALIIGPSVAGPKLNLNLQDSLPDQDMITGLFQPNPIGYDEISLYHNDTGPIDANTDIIASESSVLEEYERTKADAGPRPTDGSDSGSGDSSDTGSGGDDTSTDAPADDSGSGETDGELSGSDEEGFSGRKLVRLL